jgi:preprotein translocase subunit SecE
MFSKLATYLRETRGEITHISWPTRRQVVLYTALVAVLSLATAAYLGILDALLTRGLGILLG